MRFSILLFFLLFLHSPAFCQKNSDSITLLNLPAGESASGGNVYFQQWDSAQKSTIQEWQKKNSKTLDQFLADRKEEMKKERRRNYLMAGLGALLLIVLLFRLMPAIKKRSALRF